MFNALIPLLRELWPMIGSVMPSLFFLFNREMRVRINNKFSSWINVISGIPQGSILGPLLFIIFNNDLPEVCGEVSNIFLYADDAKLFKHIQTPEDRSSLQDMFNNVQLWIVVVY